MKRKFRALEETSAHLRAENQRLESEGTKQQRRIDQLLNLSDGAKNIGMSSEIRRDIEKSILVRQLKNQINNLRSDFADKEAELETLRRNIKSTHLSEIENEREEYFLEVQRLKSALLDVKEELQRERQRREWNTRVAGDASDDLRKEVARLSSGYQGLLTNISNRSRPSSSSGMRTSSGPESPTAHSNRPVSAAATSSTGKELGIGERPKRPQSANATRVTPLSTYFQAEVGASATSATFSSDPLDNFGVAGAVVSGKESVARSDLPVQLHVPQVLAQANSSFTDQGIFKKGERVEALYQGGSEWYQGEVAQYNRDGSYAVRYDDGDYEASVPLARIRVLPNSPSVKEAPTKMPSLIPTLAPAPASHPALMGGAMGGSASKLKPGTPIAALSTSHATYKANEKIEALYFNGKTWYGGKIQAVRAVSEEVFVYDVTYDDGDRELKVPEANIRRAGGAGPAPTPAVAPVPAPVSTPSSPTKAAPTSTNAASTNAKAALHKVGDKVEGFYGGGPSWYGATVKKINPPDSAGRYTYALDYNDGDRETAALEANVRAVPTQTAPVDVAPAPVAASASAVSGPPATHKYKKGTRVQGYFAEVTSWYDGTVEKCNADGTYHVQYDDGDEDIAAPEDVLRAAALASIPDPVPAQSSPRLATAPPIQTPAKVLAVAKFSKGARVEGLYGGAGEWYPAVIAAVVRTTDDSFVYNLDYDDGDNEKNVAESYVRLLAPAPSSAGAPAAPPTATTSSASAAQRKPSIVNTNLDSFLNDLSDDEEDGAGVGGGLDSGRGVLLRPTTGAGLETNQPSASIEKAETEDEGYDEDFDA